MSAEKKFGYQDSRHLSACGTEKEHMERFLEEVKHMMGNGAQIIHFDLQAQFINNSAAKADASEEAEEAEEVGMAAAPNPAKTLTVTTYRLYAGRDGSHQYRIGPLELKRGWSLMWAIADDDNLKYYRGVIGSEHLTYGKSISLSVTTDSEGNIKNPNRGWAKFLKKVEEANQ